MSIELDDTDCETVDVNVGNQVDGVVTVELRRPDARNALDSQLRADLKRIMRRISDSEVRVVVLTGSPESEAFVAGADITELNERDALEQREASKRPRVYEIVDNCPMPVIARINGHALGGGCELIQACDVRIAHEDALIGQPEINLGIMPGGGGTQRLPRLIGEGQAMRLILTGELLDADEAADIGLVEEVHGDDTFDERIYELAEQMAEKSPVALEFAKQAVQASSRMDLQEGIEYEAELFAQLFGSLDKEEGITAFLEERDPEWHGK